MVVGSGASLSATGTGTIAATSLAGPFGIPVASVVSTAETRTSSSYGALGTAQAVTVTVSAAGRALVSITTQMEHTSSSSGCAMSFSVDGTGGFSASDVRSVLLQGTTGIVSPGVRMGGTWLVTGLTGGGTRTFTAQFRTMAADTTTCTFSDRNLIVTPY